jgi:hypothetical protein
MMKRFLVCFAVLIPAISAMAQNYLPRDVQRLMDHRESCAQERRAADAKDKLLKLCMGAEKELAQLKRKYAANSTIMQILNQFEIDIDIAESKR